jgi:hypothetical protein
MTGHDPTLPSPPVEAGPAPFANDLPYGHDNGWTDTQRTVVSVTVALIAFIVFMLVVFVFSGPDEETVPAPTVPVTAAPAIAPTTPTTASIAPPSS